LTCFNCRKKGHKKADCWGEGGGKAGQAPWEKGKGGSDEKGDKAKGKEVAASVQEYDAAWMVVSDEPNSEDGNKNSYSPSTWPSLDKLLDRFNPENNNNKIPIESFSTNSEQLEDSDDLDDEGDLDEWEDDSA